MLKPIRYTVGSSGRAALVALAAAALTLGCEPPKELPKPEERTTQKTVRSVPPDPRRKNVPATSDPKAKAAAERALAAICNNTPGALAKGRVSVTRAHGVMSFPTDVFDNSEREVQVVWPDRAHVVYVLKSTKSGTSDRRVLGMQDQAGWLSAPGAFQQNFSPADMAQVFTWDLLSEHWFLLGLPFQDPAAVYFDLHQDAAAKAITLKVAWPDRPVYEITFSDQTHLIESIAYDPLEVDMRSRVSKQAFFSQYKVEGGLQLPMHFSKTQNKLKAEEWEIDSWEFPAKLDAALFAPPK